MSTSAIYTFYDSANEIHVYKHHDGYPYCKFPGGEGGGLVWINDAKAFAWDLPRFEADEFAASFVKANKSVGGGIRLIANKEPLQSLPDCAYWYNVKAAVPALDVWVDVYRVYFHFDSATADDPKFENELIMSGALSELLTSERARMEVA